jgi:hypothetical protein
MALQIMEASKSQLACIADEWLLLAVCKQMTLQIMLTGEFGVTIGALVLSLLLSR